MSEVGVLQPESPEHRAEPAAKPSAGTLLRLAREAAGLHVAALAVSLKIPVKKLEALEADRIDLLPDAVFARALAASVCRTLKIDPTEILANLPQTQPSRLEPESMAVKATFRPSSPGRSTLAWSKISRPFVVVGLLLVVGALALLLFPVAERSLIPTAAVIPAEPAVPVFPAVAPITDTALPSPPATGFVAPPDATAGVVASTSSSSGASNGAVAVSASMAVPIPGKTPDTAAASGPASSVVSGVVSDATGIVVLKSRGTSWVEVKDSGGVVQLRKTLAVGETVGVSGGLPLSVIVGKADATDVQVRGKPFDMTPLTKDNVARFEVR